MGFNGESETDDHDAQSSNSVVEGNEEEDESLGNI